MFCEEKSYVLDSLFWTLFSRPGQEADLQTLRLPKSLVKETAPLAKLKAGTFRVVSNAKEGEARSDGGKLTRDMKRKVMEVGYDVKKGEKLSLEWERSAGMGGKENKVTVRSTGCMEGDMETNIYGYGNMETSMTGRAVQYPEW